MDENNKSIVGEEDLDTVAGGGKRPPPIDPKDKECYFYPGSPVQHNGKQDGVLKVKCSQMTCGGFVSSTCACHGTNRCVNKWHIMEYVGGDIWSPSIINENHHRKSDKAVRDSSIPK